MTTTLTLPGFRVTIENLPTAETLQMAAILENPPFPRAWSLIGDESELTERGGVYWREDEPEGDDRCVIVVRVTPCAREHGPRNLFAITHGVLWTQAHGRAAIELLCQNAPLDAPMTQIVRLGRLDRSWNGRGWNPHPDRILGARTSLAAYVRQHYLD